jgi:hypothetical protein
MSITAIALFGAGGQMGAPDFFGRVRGTDPGGAGARRTMLLSSGRTTSS